jgi:hypothetical protein
VYLSSAVRAPRTVSCAPSGRSDTGRESMPSLSKKNPSVLRLNRGCPVAQFMGSLERRSSSNK